MLGVLHPPEPYIHAYMYMVDGESIVCQIIQSLKKEKDLYLSKIF
jgi:hypothetical protein